MTTHREPYRIVIEPGIFRGIDVLVAPPTQTHPLRHFKTHAEAVAYADDLARIEGWPVTDRTGGAA